jgi:hypothetical protein
MKGMEVHSYNPSAWKAKTGGPWVWGQTGLHSKFQANLNYIERPCIKTNSKIESLQPSLSKVTKAKSLQKKGSYAWVPDRSNLTGLLLAYKNNWISYSIMIHQSLIIILALFLQEINTFNLMLETVKETNKTFCSPTAYRV